MARRCTVCSNPNRHTIDHALVEGTSTAAALAREYGVSEDAVRRHRENGHLPRLLSRIAGSIEMLTGDRMLAEFVDRYDGAMALVARSEAEGWEPKDAVAAAREARAAIESLARIGLAMVDRAQRGEPADARPDLDERIERVLARRERATEQRTSEQAAPVDVHSEVVDAEVVEADGDADDVPAWRRALAALPAGQA